MSGIQYEMQQKILSGFLMQICQLFQAKEKWKGKPWTLRYVSLAQGVNWRILSFNLPYETSPIIFCWISLNRGKLKTSSEVFLSWVKLWAKISSKFDCDFFGEIAIFCSIWWGLILIFQFAPWFRCQVGYVSRHTTKPALFSKFFNIMHQGKK